ncbi:unnamed protein product [Nippostrongylus brasiliensis]|uniref:WD_REPEATS_REGION domain-containing protein n=1 Tax=Nippostrongylus brasiliensis TaxID=27835 RepID=A0A0N4XTN0_NIPBR|nr:unnamed protein product [Nippostrongylus brasiliensis]
MLWREANQGEDKGGIVAEYAHCFDPYATNAESHLEIVSLNSILSKPAAGQESSVRPSKFGGCHFYFKNFYSFSIFNELSWAPLISDAHPSGIVFGGTENGTVVFFDAHKLVQSSTLSVITARRDHQGHVLSVDYSSDNKWALSAGGAGQLLLWDLSNLATPFSPGVPNFTDQVKRVRWNRVMSNIAVSVSAHRGSLWDMRRPGGPVLEFAEMGAGCDWADVCWKPGDSSTLILCSQLALAPGIQQWDLRYLTAPVTEFHVHDRGVTAIDWSVFSANIVSFHFLFCILLIYQT